MSLWDEPAGFWLGAGMVAEAPIVLVTWLMPAGSCNAILGRVIDCPPPIWFLCLIALISYFLVAWGGHKLGLGESKN